MRHPLSPMTDTEVITAYRKWHIALATDATRLGFIAWLTQS